MQSFVYRVWSVALVSTCLCANSLVTAALEAAAGVVPPVPVAAHGQPSSQKACDSCAACHALLRRPTGPEETASGLGSAAGSLLERRLVCSPHEEESAGEAHRQDSCTSFCSENCRPQPPRKAAEEVPCVPKTKPAKMSLAQLSTAYELTGCPEPKPCICACYCAPDMYGTALPIPPTPFATATPPQLSRLLQLKSHVALERQFEQEMSAAAVEPRPIVLGPMPPPVPPPPPPPDRSYCPKAAPCNCFCPCRE